MERKLATIERILNIYPIEGADAIEVAEVRGWNVVIKKDSFKVGDLCVYCEIDSVMPDRPEFEFLAPRRYRIRTVKLRGQVSQGIIFPLEILKEVGEFQPVPSGDNFDTVLVCPDKDPEELSINWLIPIAEGEDVTDALGVIKYDPAIPACLAGISRGNFPSHTIKTDEERIQNLKKYLPMYKEDVWIETEKLDGSSATYYIWEDEFGVASRNMDLIESEGNSFWKVARDLDIETVMRTFMNKHDMKGLSIQGELIGEGIQGNKYKLKGQTVRFFRALDTIKYEFIPYLEFIDMIKEMGCETVPILNLAYKLPDSYEELIAHVDGRSKLADTAREGSVFVSATSTKDNGRLSFKIISNKFILKHDE